MIAAIGALALLSVTYTGPVTDGDPSETVRAALSDTQTVAPGKPSVLVVLVNADGSTAGELKSSKISSRVEVQIFEEDTVSDSELVVHPEDKPLAQSFVWMRELAYRMLNRSFEMKSKSHPGSSVSGFQKVVIVREVSDEEYESTEPAEQRAERAITGILGG